MNTATLFSIIGWIVTGAIAGYVASLVLRAERQGCLLNIALGVAGAFVGGFVMSNFFPGLFNLFGEKAGFLNTILHAIVGAVLILVVIEIIVPGKQLGVRKDKPRKRRR
jgi:uncharacterized membrane protein YeaQ/YmgE (transglycosylase-associated protein family)